MKPLFRKTRYGKKSLCLFLAVAFLSLTVSCSHTPPKSTGRQETERGTLSAGETQAARAHSEEDPWWKKPEYEWLFVTLIAIGIGVAAGGAIMISSGAGGLRVVVNK